MCEFKDSALFLERDHVAASSDIIIWADGIKAELVRCLPGQRKTQRDKLAVLVATMRHVRSANLVELAAGLPRWSDRLDMGYQWISRFLENERVCCDTVMRSFAVDILARAAKPGDAIPLILDQSKLSDRHQVLMLSVRRGERVLPLAWRVEETEGAIGFPTKENLLDAVRTWLPGEARVVLHADRFYGTPELIRLCRERGWDYRLRLKGNLTTRIGSRKARTGELANSGGNDFNAVTLTGKRVEYQHRHHPRSRTHRALDHRDVGKARLPHHARRREPLGYRADVPRLQVARLRHRADPNPLSRPRRPPDPGDGARALLGSLHRHVGRRRNPSLAEKTSDR